IIDNKIIFMSNKDNEHHLYYYDLQTGEVFQISKGIYQDEGVIYKNNLYYVGLNSNGFDIYEKENDTKLTVNFQNRTNKIQFLSNNNTENFMERENLNNLQTHLLGLFPKIRFPFYLPDSDRMFYGLYFMGENTLSSINYDLLFTHEDKTEIELNLYTKIFKPIYTYLYSTENKLIQEFAMGLPFYFYSPNTNYALYFSCDFENYVDSSGFGGTLNFFAEKLFFTYNIYLNSSKSYESVTFSDTSSDYHITFNYSTQDYIVENNLFYHYYDKFFANIFLKYRYSSISLIKDSYKYLIGRLEIGKRLFKFHKGLWNPNIYFQDLFIKISGSYEYSIIFDEFYYRDYSMEISIAQEIKLLFQIPIFFEVSIKTDLKNKPSFNFGIGLDSEFYMSKTVKRLFHWNESKDILKNMDLMIK
ncbi:hypothetical protein J7L48_01660, partial [bacterium]|nr:hypothetical protein [bacterium]